MQCEPPDTRIYTELESLNAAFLRLVATHDGAGRASVFGLDAAVSAALMRLTSDELDSSPGRRASLPRFPCCRACDACPKPA